MRRWSAVPMRCVLHAKACRGRSRRSSPSGRARIALFDQLFPSIGLDSGRPARGLICSASNSASGHHRRAVPRSHARLRRTAGRGRVPSAFEVDVAGLDRPEPAAAGFVAQIGALVGGADEAALPRLDHFMAAVGRPIAFGLPGDESLEQRRFRLCSWPSISEISISHLPRRCCETSLPLDDVGQAVGVPLAAEDRAGGRFLRLPCGPSSTDHVVGLAAGLENPRHHRDQEHRADRLRRRASFR